MGVLEIDDYITTFSKKKLNIIKPKTNQICIDDIARGLAFKGHFAGQTPWFFSIAEHSLWVVDEMQKDGWTNPEILMVALIHDGSEAFYGDMVKPLKVHLDKFMMFENQLQEVIFNAFKVSQKYMWDVKPYDKLVQEKEFRLFHAPSRPDQKPDHYFLDPDTAYVMFMHKYGEIQDQLNDFRNNEG